MGAILNQKWAIKHSYAASEILKKGVLRKPENDFILIYCNTLSLAKLLRRFERHVVYRNDDISFRSETSLAELTLAPSGRIKLPLAETRSAYK